MSGTTEQTRRQPPYRLVLVCLVPLNRQEDSKTASLQTGPSMFGTTEQTRRQPPYRGQMSGPVHTLPGTDTHLSLHNHYNLLHNDYVVPDCLVVQILILTTSYIMTSPRLSGGSISTSMTSLKYYF